jgi:WD40 repeat protein
MRNVTWVGLSLAVFAAAAATARAEDHPPLKPARLIKGHTDYVAAVAFSADGKLLATGGDDSSVRLWDVASGDRQALIQHTAKVEALAFSPDGKVVVAGDRGGEVNGWDVATKEKKFALKVAKNRPVSFLTFSPDGETLAAIVYDTKEVQLWSLSPAQVRATLKGHDGLVRAAAFSPDGKTVATASTDSSARIWDGASGKEKDALKAHDGPVESVVFSTDGSQLITGGADGTVRRWDIKTGNVIKPVFDGPSAKYRDVIYVRPTPSGRVVSVTWGDAFDVWDPAQNKPLHHAKGFEGLIGSSGVWYYDYLALSPDGKILVRARRSEVEVYDVSQLTGEMK